MTTPISTQWVYLGPDPKSLYRQLFIKGTRIMARSLYGLYMNAEEPMTAEAIAAEYALPLGAVQEAIAYCQSDPPEVKQDFEAEEALMEATGMNDANYKYHPSPKVLAPEEMYRLNRL